MTHFKATVQTGDIMFIKHLAEALAHGEAWNLERIFCLLFSSYFDMSMPLPLSTSLPTSHKLQVSPRGTYQVLIAYPLLILEEDNSSQL